MIEAVPIRSSTFLVAPDAELLRAWHPGDPIGKGRPRCTCQGKVPRLYTPKRTTDAEVAVKATLLEAWKAGPTNGPLVLELLFAMATDRRVDVDNLAKLVLDAGNHTIWRDDAQIEAVYARRIHAPSRASVGTLVLVGRA